MAEGLRKGDLRMLSVNSRDIAKADERAWRAGMRSWTDGLDTPLQCLGCANMRRDLTCRLGRDMAAVGERWNNPRPTDTDSTLMTDICSSFLPNPQPKYLDEE